MEQRGAGPSWLLASVAALFTPPFAFALLNWTLVAGLYGDANSNGQFVLLLMWMAALCVSLAHLLLLGLPAVALLRKWGWWRWWSLTAVGAALGAMPMAFYSWPRFLPGEGASDSTGVKVIDGIPTAAWWHGYAHDVASMALIGALTGLVFWLVWARSARGSKDA